MGTDILLHYSHLEITKQVQEDLRRIRDYVGKTAVSSLSTLSMPNFSEFCPCHGVLKKFVSLTKWTLAYGQEPSRNHRVYRSSVGTSYLYFGSKSAFPTTFHWGQAFLTNDQQRTSTKRPYSWIWWNMFRHLAVILDTLSWWSLQKWWICFSGVVAKFVLTFIQIRDAVTGTCCWCIWSFNGFLGNISHLLVQKEWRLHTSKG